MIISFYDNNFVALQNNASLVISKDSYSLIKRPIEMNSLNCLCESFSEDIQPTFLVIKDDKGSYIYGSLAGIPLINENNQTEINGTDIKSILSSDIIIYPKQYLRVFEYLSYIFNEWNRQVNQLSINTELLFTNQAKEIEISDLIPNQDKTVVNAYDEMSKYLKFYNLYIDSKVDVSNKKVIFFIGKAMDQNQNLNIRLSDYGILNYGKWIADVNEAQGYYNNSETETWEEGYKWVLKSNNTFFTLKSGYGTPDIVLADYTGQFYQDLVTNNFYVYTDNGWIKTENPRDMFPIKRKVIVSDESLTKANEDSLTELLNSLYNENIELNADDVLKEYASFETAFSIYIKKGQDLYKILPCGELNYDANGLKKVQIGYRYTGAEFI